MLNRIIIYCISFLVLIVLEAIMTAGIAFEFDKYTVIGVICQVLVIILCIAVAEKATQSENKTKKV